MKLKLPLIAVKFLTVASIAAATLLPANMAHAQTGNSGAQAQAIANQFTAVKTMTGEFVQFGPKGDQTGGKFYIERPGKFVSIMINLRSP